MALRASPPARRTRESAMPSPIGILAGMMIASSPLATLAAGSWACIRRASAASRKIQNTSDQAAGGEPARVGSIARAERTRNRGRKGDGQADIDRHEDKGHLAGVAHRGL